MAEPTIKERENEIQRLYRAANRARWELHRDKAVVEGKQLAELSGLLDSMVTVWGQKPGGIHVGLTVLRKALDSRAETLTGEIASAIAGIDANPGDPNG